MSVAVAVAGCGGSGSSSSSSGSTSESTTTTAASKPSEGETASGTPIPVGTICTCGTTTSSTELATLFEVGKAWEEQVNANGGINGHPVKLYTEEDEGNASKGLEAAKKLIEEDHVIAIVSEASQVGEAWAPYVLEKGVPVVGGQGADVPEFTNPDFFPIGPSLPAVITAQFHISKERGATKMAINYCAEAAACQIIKGQAEKLVGLVPPMEVVTTAKISSTQPNYIATCLANQEAGAESLWPGTASPTIEKLASDCEQQGFEPQFISNGPTSASSWLSAPQLEGMVIVDSHANYEDSSLPAIQEMNEALEQYAPEVIGSEEYSTNSLVPWVSGKLFEAAAEKADVGPESTPEEVKEGLYALKGETLGGLTQPLTYEKGKATHLPCWFTVEISEGSFKSLNGDKPQCLSPEENEEAIERSGIQEE
jgi:branched-chain amino acid transport system substrate-binding protein